MGRGNKIMLCLGVGAVALIGLLMIVRVVIAPAGRVDEAHPVVDTSAADRKAQFGWVADAHQPVIEVTDQTFESAVLASNRLVLVDFWASWCGPCVEMEPVVEAFAEQHADTLRVTKVDVEQNPQTAREYRVDALPTLVLFHKGREVDRIEGLLSLEQLTHEVEHYVEQQGHQPKL